MSEPSRYQPEPSSAPPPYDFTVLSRRPSLRRRVQGLSGDPRLVIGAVIGVLLLAIPGIVLLVMVTMLARGQDIDYGGLFFVLLLLGSGVFVLFDVSRQSGGSGAFATFADRNGLRWIRPALRRDYAGSEFAAGTHSVAAAVRTRGVQWLEVGERIRSTNPRRREVRPLQGYLRARLSGPERLRPSEPVITSALDRDLRDLLGSYRVELAGDELTVFGERPLDPVRADRLERAMTVGAAIVRRADRLGPVTKVV